MGRRGNVTEESFGEILRDGVSSTRSYVVLKQKNRSPVYLCFKPFLQRPNSSVIYVGGKLAVFADQTHEKWAEITSDRVRTEALKAAWKRLPQDRVSAKRVGSNAGVYMIGSPSDQVVFAKKFDTTHIINKLISAIEEHLKVEITERDDVKAFLSWYYHTYLQAVFYSGHEGTAIPDRLIGKSSEVLFGQSHTEYASESLIEFMKYYNLVAKTEEETEIDENGEEDEAA